MNYIQAVQQALLEKLETDENSIILGQDIRTWGGAGGLFKGFADKFNKRIIDTPISEAATMGIAVGAAMNGTRAIVEFSFMDFTLDAIDQIINQAAKIKFMSNNQFTVPVIIRGAVSSTRGYGATHSQSFENIYASVPGLQVVYPSNGADAYGLMISALESSEPIIFMEHKNHFENLVDEPLEKVEIGKASIKKTGKKLTVITYGMMTNRALEIEDDIEIIDLRSLAPLDYETIYKSVKKTGYAIIYEEGYGFLGGEISANIHENISEFLKAPVRRLHTKRDIVSCNTEEESDVFPSSNDLKDMIASIIK